ncbi:hypothetical protein FRC20_002402 [Serendipita sp. 405]|nr:hypothetical protein FRC20_002402 [Serendipita sp. 405]
MWEKHRGDLDRCYTDAAGVKRIRVFEVLIKKGAVLSNDWEKVSDHHRSYQSFPSDLGEFSTTIYAWEGQGETKWVVDANNQVIPGMRKFCSLKADLSRLRSSLREQRGENGQRYWRVQYHVVLTFGRSNLQARLRWDENGVRKEGPITVLPTTAY